VRLTNERVGVFLARRSVQHLVGSPMVIHKQTIKYLNIFTSTQDHIISQIYFLSDKSFQQKIKRNLPSPMLLGNDMILLGLSNVPQSLLSKLLTFILSVVKTRLQIYFDTNYSKGRMELNQICILKKSEDWLRLPTIKDTLLVQYH
jgi:hypothetical protein